MNNLIPQSGAKTQRLAKKNHLVFFVPSTTLSRLRGMKCFSLSANYFKASCDVGYILSFVV